MGHFRQTPRGLGKSVNEDFRRNMVLVSLDDMADTGNRAQRRWAKKKIARTAGKNNVR